MWWAGKRGVVTVYLGQEEIRLAHGEAQQVVAGAMPLAEALPLLQEALKLLGRVRLRVLVSGGWCQPFLLPSVEGVSSREEWLQVAAGLLQDMTGMPASSRLWLDGDQRTPALAVALHPDVDTVLNALASQGQVLELRPWWAAVLAAQPDSTKGVAVIDSDAVTLLMADGDRYEVAQSYSLMGEPASAVLARALISQGRHRGEVVVKRMLDAASSAPPSAADSVPFLEVSA